MSCIIRSVKKYRPWNDLLYVQWDVQLFSTNASKWNKNLHQNTAATLAARRTSFVGMSGGVQPQPPVHVYRWVKIGFKFESLYKISNISTSDSPPQFF